MDPPAIEKPPACSPVAFRLSLTTILIAGGNCKRAVSTGLTCDAVLSTQGIISPKQEGRFTSNSGNLAGECEGVVFVGDEKTGVPVQMLVRKVIVLRIVHELQQLRSHYVFEGAGCGQGIRGRLFCAVFDPKRVIEE